MLTKSGVITRLLKRMAIEMIGVAQKAIIPWYLARRTYILRRYFRENATYKLHIGAGPCALEGWLNTDCTPATEWATSI